MAERKKIKSIDQATLEMIEKAAEERMSHCFRPGGEHEALPYRRGGQLLQELRHGALPGTAGQRERGNPGRTCKKRRVSAEPPRRLLPPAILSA